MLLNVQIVLFQKILILDGLKRTQTTSHHIQTISVHPAGMDPLCLLDAIAEMLHAVEMKPLHHLHPRQALVHQGQVLAQKSLSGRKETEQLEARLHQNFSALNKSAVDFEDTWKWCHGSLSKSCQTLRNAKNKSKS